MKRNYEGLEDFFKDFDESTLWVVNNEGRLVILVCPFLVRAMYRIGKYRRDDKVFVDAIKVTPELKTVFMIENKPYNYTHFDIIIRN